MPETAEERSERNRRAALIKWSTRDTQQRATEARLADHERWAKYPNPEAARKAEMANRRWQKLKKQREASEK